MNVRHVLEGSVRKAGDNVRITAQLIDASNDKHLWSETFDRTLSAESIFEIQDEIAQAIVGALGVIIDSDESVHRAADTQNLNAYEAYLQANQLFLSRRDLSRSAGLFMQAVEADPQFARAWAGLSAVAAVAPSWLVYDRDYRTISDEAARKAIAIDDSLALPYAVLLWRGMNHMRTGYFEKALADFRRCLELDPAYELCRRHIANTMVFLGSFEQAIEVYKQGLKKGFTGGSDAIDAYILENGQELAFLLATATGRAPNRLWASIRRARHWIQTINLRTIGLLSSRFSRKRTVPPSIGNGMGRSRLRTSTMRRYMMPPCRIGGFRTRPTGTSPSIRDA